MDNDELNHHVLRHLQDRPNVTQRQLAKKFGISLGKVNYCLRALIARGLVKVNNFRDSSNKTAYMYLLTRKGLAQKSRSTAQFLQRKMAEYEALQREIERLRKEVMK